MVFVIAILSNYIAFFSVTYSTVLRKYESTTHWQRLVFHLLPQVFHGTSLLNPSNI